MSCRSFVNAVVEARRLWQAVARMRRITQQLPPHLFVPHTVKAWHAPCSSSSSGSQQQQCVPAIVAGEALASVGVSTMASLLQEVRRPGGLRARVGGEGGLGVCAGGGGVTMLCSSTVTRLEKTRPQRQLHPGAGDGTTRPPACQNPKILSQRTLQSRLQF